MAGACVLLLLLLLLWEWLLLWALCLPHRPCRRGIIAKPILSHVAGHVTI